MVSTDQNEDTNKSEIILSSDELDRLLHHDNEIIAKVLGKTEIEDTLLQRVLVRPSVNWTKLIASLLAVLCAIALTIWLAFFTGIHYAIKAAIVIISAVVIRFAIKMFMLQMIKVYQRFAPEEIRRRCKCFPSCSEYTEQAIRKYGIVKGTVMGFRRTRRCGAEVRGDDPLP